MEHNKQGNKAVFTNNVGTVKINEARLNEKIELPNGVTILGNGDIVISSPTVEQAKSAARVIKRFCNSRNDDPETDCTECPIHDLCGTDPYSWEV